ncbi:MAG: SusC/RagA family TonB-linked outer membrane protein [Mangrovibacterium sp.]
MKKINWVDGKLMSFYRRKAFLIMKLHLLFILGFALQSYATVGQVQTKRFSLQFENNTIKEVLGALEDQTDYSFIYKDEQLKSQDRVTGTFNERTVAEILDQLFSNGELSYTIRGRLIVVTTGDRDQMTQQPQQIQARGRVFDSSGNPLPGVTVVVKGTTKGTITDGDGNYFISGASTDDILVFSFVGMKSKELVLKGATSYEVVLDEEAIGIEEVVAIGYGTVRKSDLTGAVASVSSDEIKKQPVTNLSQAIQGKAPGVVVSNSSGAPGGAVKVRIRGANSMLGSNDPLYIVDGVALNVGINDLNVNDIQSVEVLKDASSTAIYGSRGANGVILITTKSGTSQKAKLQLTSNTGVSTLANKYDLLDAGTFAELVDVYKPGYFTASEIADYKANGGVDWQDEVFLTGISQDYQLSLNGGSEASKYYVSANYIDQKGIVTGSKLEKYAIRSNTSNKIGNNLKFDLNMFASRTKSVNTSDNGSKGAPLWNTPLFPPTFSIYTDEANKLWNRTDNLSGPGLMNPLMVLKERYSDNLSTSIAVNSKLSYEIFKDLRLDVIFGVDNNSTQVGSITNEWMNPTTQSASLSEAKTFTWQNSNILTYHKNLGEIHDLTVVAVNEQAQFNYNGFAASGTDISPISVGYDNLGIANTKNISSYRTRNSLSSYLARISYSLMNRYLLTVSYRADGTSKFQGDNKWGYFPAAAVAWRVSEESFMKSQDVISNLKLRGSWGETGNQGINAYATIAKIGSMMNTFGLSSIPGSIVVGADNPDLKWETTEQKNVGVDVSAWQGRLNISADYYVKKTSDLLYAAKIPNYNGGGTVNKNIGEMKNKGYEVTVTGTPVSNEEFKWESSFNISSYKNKLESLGVDTFFLGNVYAAGLTTESPFAVKVGESLGSFWGYEWQGVYRASEAAEAAKYGFQPGDNKYLDYNRDGIIDSKDKHIIGNALPKFVWGFDNTFTYKNLELNIMLQAVHGRKILNTVYAASTTILSDATAISHVDGADFWTSANDDARFANPNSSTGKNFIESTQFLQDGSYVKVKNIALAYNLGRNVVKIADLKFTLSGQNLLTFTNYKGYDPETSTSNNDIDGAIDVGSYPNARTVTFSIQANF